MKCPHEDDLNYGKHLEIDETHHILHMMCAECGAVGSMLEERDMNEPDHWYELGEIWHEPSDYFNDEIAKNCIVGLLNYTLIKKI